jgi:hypothetical protein
MIDVIALCKNKCSMKNWTNRQTECSDFASVCVPFGIFQTGHPQDVHLDLKGLLPG